VAGSILGQDIGYPDVPHCFPQSLHYLDEVTAASFQIPSNSAFCIALFAIYHLSVLLPLDANRKATHKSDSILVICKTQDSS
jgi:hypothetical protein